MLTSSASRLHILIEDQDQEVYQVPTEILPRPSSEGGSATNSELVFSYTESPFTFAVSRKSSGETLFNTSDSPLIFESQFLNLRTSLPENPNLYGLGEAPYYFGSRPGLVSLSPGSRRRICALISKGL